MLFIGMKTVGEARDEKGEKRAHQMCASERDARKAFRGGQAEEWLSHPEVYSVQHDNLGICLFNYHL
jgi:hypothetical protein